MSQTKAAAGAAALASLVMVGGCAGNQPIPATSIQQAEQRLDEAERSNAQRYANRELNMAREKLLQAREAQDEGDEELAARLAEHAELDAAYAIALSDNESVQAAVDELRATLATLESELQRNQGASLSDGVASPSDDIDVSLRDDSLDLGPSDGDVDPADEIRPSDPFGPDPLRSDPLPSDPLRPDPLRPEPLGSDPLGADPLRPDPLTESPDIAPPDRGL